MRVYYSKDEVEFPRLPAPRYLHQMVSLPIGGKPHLLVIGGKENVSDASAVNTVFKLNIEDFIKAKGNKATAERAVSWEQVASMTDPRCMFSATVVDKRFVYVYGGTKEGVQGQNKMPDSICERYDSVTNTWASFAIEGAPNLSSFGWCPGTDKGVIYVLGGSDGCTLQSSCWKIDFVSGNAK